MCEPIQRGGLGACLTWNDNLSPSYWCDHNCISTIEEAINTGKDGILKFNSDNMSQVQSLTSKFLETYTKNYSFTDDVVDQRFNPFQFDIMSMCRSIDGVCQPFLTSYCKNFSRQDLQDNTSLRSMCGCYVIPDPIDLEHTNNPACDSLCRRGDVVQKVTINNRGPIPLTCSTGVCVINNTHVSDTKTPINITSFCPNCDGNCYCVVSGTNIEQTLSSVGVTNINFNQFCGENSICSIIDPVTQTVTSRTCDVGQLQPQYYSYIPSVYFFMFFIIIIIIVIIAVLLKSF